jgi:hypothetical protein
LEGSRKGVVMGRQKTVRADAGESANPKRARKPGYVRLTLDIPVGLDIRLGALAKSKEKRKGAFALQMLDQGCRQYDLDKVLRAAFPEIPGEAEPVE